MRNVLTLIAALLTGAILASGAWARPADPIRVLIVDGQNNHNWRATTPVLVDILEDPGLFDVDVATTEADVSKFRPDFAKYDVVVSNYNGADWPEATRTAFVDFIRSGGGLVVVHAADNSFPGWKEYNEMIGLGGWGGRNEKSGPMVYWEDGGLVRDDSPGRGGTHGPQHPFQLTTRNAEHPIMAGLPEVWMHASDELYSKLRGPAKNMTMLATAYADPAKGGTGRHEPALFTVTFGEGRIFHTILGHDAPQMKCMGFVFTLQRGTEWAATGNVTLTKVPESFPTAEEVRLWEPAAVFKSIESYDFGESRRDLAAIETMLRGASPAALRKHEARLLEALESPQTKYAGKQFVMRLLRRIGSDACVPTLAGLLEDPELSHLARFALESLPSPKATDALRAALSRVDGALKIGVVGSLGNRGDRAAVADVASLVHAESPALATAAIRALGRLGGNEALVALDRAEVAAALEPTRQTALLECADGVLREGGVESAAKVYRAMAADPSSASVARLAAWRGVLMAERARAVPAVLDLLGSSELALAEGAVQLLRSVAGADVTVAIAAALSTLPPERQLEVIDVLVSRADRSAHDAVLAASRSEAAAVRLAAIRALGILGDARAVEPLAALLGADQEAAAAALESLSRLGGEGIAEAIGRLLRSEDADVRERAIDLLLLRRETTALPSLLEATRDEVESIRAAACRAVGALGGDKELGALAAMIVRARHASDRTALGQALRSIADRVGDPQAATASLLEVLPSASAEAKQEIIAALAVLSTEAGLEAIRAEVRSESESVRRAAVDALGSWGTPAPIGDVLKLARDSTRPELQAPALRGYLALLSLPANRPSTETVSLLKEALGLTRDAEVRKTIVAKLGEFPCKEGLEIAKQYVDDPTLGETAKSAADSIQSILVAGSLVATASHNSGDTKNAFDKNPGTRWTTGTPMRPGMWFQLDLGAEQSVRRIVLDCRDSPGDYPRGAEVYVSFDGKTWAKPVLTSPPQRPITRLELPEPTRARFVRIVQTGETQGLFWSIHELNLVLD